MSLARLRNIADLRAAARRRLPRVVFDYLDGGAEDHLTVRANREAFEKISFSPRTLVDVSQRSQRTALFGREFDCPFGIAPLGASALYWHEADIALARAARAANVPFVLSTHSFVPLERVAFEAGGAPWFQLYMPREREAAAAAVARARDAGCDALVLTTDVPVGGNREYNERNGLTIPLRLGLRTIIDGVLHPRWLAGVYLRSSFHTDAAGWGVRRDCFDWDDLAWLRSVWPRRLVVKGILCAEDARLAVERGADGIVVSNHGGRQLDGAPATLEALPRIADAVRGRCAVLVDGGVRRGADIVKALALGADLVLIGRAALYGVAAAGEAGVHRALQLLRSEVDRVLALLGCNSVRELGPHHLRLARPGAAISLAPATRRAGSSP